jgi:uncharacterized protein
MTLEELLKERREAILRICAKHGARNVRVFGSVARGEAGEGSDIDLLVEFEPGQSLLDHAALMLDLEDLLGRKVDIATEKGLYWLLPQGRGDVPAHAGQNNILREMGTLETHGHPSSPSFYTTGHTGRS